MQLSKRLNLSGIKLATVSYLMKHQNDRIVNYRIYPVLNCLMSS